MTEAFDKAWDILKFGYPTGYDVPEEVRARHNIQPTDPSEQVVDNVSVDVDGRNFQVPVNAGGLVPHNIYQALLDKTRRLEALVAAREAPEPQPLDFSQPGEQNRGDEQQ